VDNKNGLQGSYFLAGPFERHNGLPGAVSKRSTSYKWLKNPAMIFSKIIH
jgi:hypothetical protein